MIDGKRILCCPAVQRTLLPQSPRARQLKEDTLAIDVLPKPTQLHYHIPLARHAQLPHVQGSRHAHICRVTSANLHTPRS